MRRAPSSWLLGLLLAPTLAFGQWQQQDTKDGVQLWTQRSASGQLQIKAQCQAVTRLSAFVAVMNDLPAIPKWMAFVSSVVQLDKPSSTQDIVATQFDLPWPAKNRDMITLSTWHQDPDLTLHLTFTDQGGDYPLAPGFIRMKKVSGEWTLTPQSQGMTQIQYVGSADAGGWLPHWLVNHLSLRSTAKTMASLCSRITKLEYQDAQYPFVTEPAATRTRSEQR
ncbi:START domain-containing protein [Gallaecimonas mangrovi]|uniref:START domain-containing protein n=1 Tax=Gallaecimonas mangrovi TaxID=2291597 RepID=UPI001D0324C5|nr:START domain-containing protein [Gallaecimonas mangrovi]